MRGAAHRDRPGVVVGHSPAIAGADEDVGGDDVGTVDRLATDDERHVAEELGGGVEAANPRRALVLEDRPEARDHVVAAAERVPAGVDAGNGAFIGPEALDRADVAPAERVVEGLVDAENVEIVARSITEIRISRPR